MNLPDYHSSNHHTIHYYGRMFFRVSSNSRKDLYHFVDLEESPDWRARYLCNCESFKYGERPCRHLKAAFESISFWCGVREEIREEWIERLVFLLSMGHSFQSAIESDYMRALSNPEPPKPEPKKVRQYTLKKRKYDPKKTTK